MQSIPILSLTQIATGAITAERFVTHVGDQAVLNENTLGVARSAASTGEDFTVDVLGTAIVEAGGSFSKGDDLQSDADGKAVAVDAGAKVARALSDGADGQRVEVLLIAN